MALIGNNGTGKTTMLKILNGLLAADAGSFTLGAKVQIGYYDQEHHVLHTEKTIFEEISDTYPTSDQDTDPKYAGSISLYRRRCIQTDQCSFAVANEAVFLLAKLMLSEANFLILDEPTNHLDIASKEILEECPEQLHGNRSLCFS